MKNLENYGVLEMNAQEMREIEGGGWLAKFIVATLFMLVAILVNRNN